MTIFIYDDLNGCFPLKCTVKRQGENIEIKNDTIKITLPIDELMALLNDEQHG